MKIQRRVPATRAVAEIPSQDHGTEGLVVPLFGLSIPFTMPRFTTLLFTLLTLDLGETAQVADNQGPRVAKDSGTSISGYGITDADVSDGNLFDVHTVAGVVRDSSVVQRQVRTLIHIDATPLVAADACVTHIHCRVSERVYAAARRIKWTRGAVSCNHLRAHSIELQRAVSRHCDPIQTVS